MNITHEKIITLQDENLKTVTTVLVQKNWRFTTLLSTIRSV